MGIKTWVLGFVLLTITFIAFNLAFNTPTKNYIPEDDLNTLRDLGVQYVGEAKPSFADQVFFYVSSFFTILKTVFNFLSVGVTNIIYDFGGILGIPEQITTLLIGGIIFVIAIMILEKISGRGGGS